MPKFIATITYHDKDKATLIKFAGDLGWAFHNENKSPYQKFGYAQNGVYVAISKEDDDEDDLLDWLNLTVNTLAEEGAEALQKRIERVIFDTHDGGIDEITPTAADRGNKYDDDNDQSEYSPGLGVAPV